ncbi:uncharacterized protein [Rutidosis leptorrhynchoides]|uniref:uncharacterized protein n=1 Tax=Rutidosis leptorrhynchoides TaxID=125765 RepID=UPI003A9934CE
MGNTSSMLTQYDIEEVQEYCNNTFSQHEIVSLYHWFCQLDRNSGGFISANEFLSVPEFVVNPFFVFVWVNNNLTNVINNSRSLYKKFINSFQTIRD